MATQSYSLIIHGGAGALEDLKYEASESEFRESVLEILAAGRERLESGVAALDVVEYCVNLLEDNPLYNAGRGSVLNENGEVEMDAALMNGEDLKAGAVTCVKRIKNPISLARQVLEQGDHVMLAAEGALEFAKFCQAELRNDEYFITNARIKQLKEAKAAGRMMLDHEKVKPSQKLGTVGAACMDSSGNLAAATSTGGLVNKRWGRVGDTPVVGAGVFADNETCAVSATGYGEQFLRTVFAKTVSDYVQFKGLDAPGAAIAGVDYLVRKVNGAGGVIVVDRHGKCAAAQSTSGLIHGWIELGSEAICKLG
ncbi:isoaspartyl peptidase/L-asparaginase family protein [cf. Phormidesmis sp. LEGE 11477]|uniref:isoaspartyl peptidase/L-asparaginase family protein n=1 Tax=cf. Phormidesmis sp. LEGE 11477 TaxID=1828680 RepID=UPI001880A74F|nr:isoaspartyl peptidase/L-asparaginase family protein [cf. Phormidesmis sp. LEGE 11477]MBE9061432.1 isoaspartyl peptidase/L-asparaginase [cf. Phormidesmis sp. LEGE 11477]